MKLLLPAITLALFAACGTETGNPEGLSFEYNATSNDTSRIRIGESQETAAVETVWLRLGDVDFVDCDGQTRGTLDGIGFADHSGTDATLQTLDLPAVPYCGVQTRLFTDPTATGEPEAFAGAALSLSGTLQDGRGFRITIDEPIPLELELDSEMVPPDAAWLVTFDVATWIDPATLEPLLGDPLEIDAASRPDLVDAFVAGVPDGVQLILDSNRNGRPDPEELVIGTP